jgi:hypothetical protein
VFFLFTFTFLFIFPGRLIYYTFSCYFLLNCKNDKTISVSANNTMTNKCFRRQCYDERISKSNQEGTQISFVVLFACSVHQSIVIQHFCSRKRKGSQENEFVRTCNRFELRGLSSLFLGRQAQLSMQKNKLPY